jgi:hypothetical protein
LRVWDIEWKSKFFEKTKSTPTIHFSHTFLAKITYFRFLFRTWKYLEGRGLCTASIQRE